MPLPRRSREGDWLPLPRLKQYKRVPSTVTSGIDDPQRGGEAIQRPTGPPEDPTVSSGAVQGGVGDTQRGGEADQDPAQGGEADQSGYRCQQFTRP